MIRRACAAMALVGLFSLAFERRAAAQEETSVATEEASGQDTSFDQSRWFAPWQFETSLVGTLGFGGNALSYGGGLGMSLRHVSEFNDRPLVSIHEDGGVLLAILSMGITAVPRGIWMGNEWGFDLRARYLQTTPLRSGTELQRLALGIAPSFRISRKDRRLRFPAVLPSFVPEIGVGLVPERAPEILIQFHPFSLGFLLSRHVALELEWTAMLVAPTDQNKAEAWVLQTLSLQLR